MLKIRPSIAILAATVLLGLERQACAFATSPAAAGASDATAASGAATSASAASAAASAASSAAPVLVQLPELTVAFVVVFFLAGVLLTIRSLRKSGTWSLAQALSEKDPSAAGAAADAQPPSSSSRMIAFLGSIGMLAMIMGFGLYALWAFFNGKSSEVKDAMQAASTYILYGSAMYAPYAFNQLKSAVKS